MVVCPKRLFCLKEEGNETSRIDANHFSPDKTMTLTMTRMYFASPHNRKTDDFLKFWETELEKLGSEQILHWAVDSYAPRLALATSFEPESCVLLAMLSKITSEITVVCTRLDYQVQRLWGISRRFHEKYGIKITPVESIQENNGDGMSEIRPATKFDAILCGARRRDHAGLKVFARHTTFDIPMIAPLARWTREAVVDKLKRDEIVCPSYWNLWER